MRGLPRPGCFTFPHGLVSSGAHLEGLRVGPPGDRPYRLGTQTNHTMTTWTRQNEGINRLGFAEGQTQAEAMEGGDAVDAYFECITTCSLDDQECITVCTTMLRDQN